MPTVSIVAPADQSRHHTATPVNFAGTASDPEDELSDRLQWSSSLDGDLGTGASISTRLSQGTHAITATAENELYGLRGSASITIVVEGPAVSTTLGGVLRLSLDPGDVSHDPGVFNVGANGKGATVVVTVDGATITITGASGFAPSGLPVLTGTISPIGMFTVSGSGTIAGIDGVSVRAEGSMVFGLGMTIWVGEDGSLPGGQAIRYGFSAPGT